MPQDKVSVEVVIPLYQSKLAAFEQFSVQQCKRILGHHQISFAKPESLNIDDLEEAYQISSRSFPDHYFKDISGYNRLMLSGEFYRAYQHVNYVLIHQLDALVFSDKLAYFCGLQVDYIGAPWLSSPASWHKKISQLFHGERKRQREIVFGKVGNGGMSLRRTASFLGVINHHAAVIENNLSRDSKDIFLMEDVFWSLTAPELSHDFKVANFEQGLAFAFDRKPEIALKMNHGQLPFSCHGFNKPKVRKFWKKIFEQRFEKVPEF